MAQTMMTVCDVCGRGDAQTVRFQSNGTKRQKDLCDRHFGDLMKGSVAVKAGRPPGPQAPKGTTVRRKRTTKAKSA